MKYSKIGSVHHEGVRGSVSKTPLIVDIGIMLRWVVGLTCLPRYWVYVDYEVG